MELIRSGLDVLFCCGVLFTLINVAVAANCTNDEDLIQAKTKSGLVQGLAMDTVSGRKISAFLSIPYAEPPIRSLRFKEPRRLKPWNGILDATKQGPRCTQMDSVDNFKIKGQEDCLYLAVYTPKLCPTETGLPVMVWFHGGFWFHGAGSMYGPRYLLDEGKVVLVTVNYRLGPFGFLTTGDKVSAGNQGLKDQVQALQWVHQNIKSFGGDANSVTIWGHSVGGSSVQLHTVSPQSRGLFNRIIADSGSAFCYWGVIKNGKEVGLQTAELFNCPTNDSVTMVNCLRNVTATALVTAESALSSAYGPVAVFGPTIEPEGLGAFITKPVKAYFDAGEAAKVPMISGVVQNEGGLITFPKFKNQSTIDGINENWTKVGPIMLGLVGDPNADLKVTKAWDFYMKGEKLSWATRERFADMYGDRTFMECTLDGIFAYRDYTNLPVYAYDFTYQGRYSVLQTLGGDPADWGVVHVDQLIYLLNNTEYYGTLQTGDPELEVSKIITNLWTNFATNGNPNGCCEGSSHGLGWQSSEKFTWQSISAYTDFNAGFLYITMKPEMVPNPFENRYHFWKEIATL